MKYLKKKMISMFLDKMFFILTLIRFLLTSNEKYNYFYNEIKTIAKIKKKFS